MSMISFENAGFAYDGASFVFRNVDLNIEEGQFVCVIGANGSGKSTLARHVNALLVPSEGRVCVAGDDTREDDLVYLVRSKVGYVFQNPDDQLVASLVENDVAFGEENLGVDQDGLRARVTRSLAAVGLTGFERREVDSLSGGQRQRLAIAGALAMEPAVLILDEASAMLDPRGGADLMRTVRSLHADGMTVVMITHVMEEAALADRIIALADGKVRMDGTPREILTRIDDLRDMRLAPPFAARVSCELQMRGVPLRTCITNEELEEELCALRSSM